MPTVGNSPGRVNRCDPQEHEPLDLLCEWCGADTESHNTVCSLTCAEHLVADARRRGLSRAQLDKYIQRLERWQKRTAGAPRLHVFGVAR